MRRVKSEVRGRTARLRGSDRGRRHRDRRRNWRTFGIERCGHCEVGSRRRSNGIQRAAHAARSMRAMMLTGRQRRALVGRRSGGAARRRTEIAGRNNGHRHCVDCQPARQDASLPRAALFSGAGFVSSRGILGPNPMCPSRPRADARERAGRPQIAARHNAMRVDTPQATRFNWSGHLTRASPSGGPQGAGRGPNILRRNSCDT